MEGKCFCCGKTGHKLNICKDRSKLKDQWAVNKVKFTNVQTTNENSSISSLSRSNDTTVSTSESSRNRQAWAGTHVGVQLYQANRMKDWILLDNESTVTLFCNPDLVENIRDMNESMEIFTNAGKLKTTQKAYVKEWGDVWYNPKAITNIFSYAEMVARFRVTYDSDTEDAFKVHLPHKIIKFERIPEGLYVLKMGEDKQVKQQVQLLTTVEENKSFYSNRQFERAKKARLLYHAVGTPSVKDFKTMINLNAIKDNPITVQDIEMAEKIFGPDISNLKGKTTRKKPLPVVEDYITIPKELTRAQKDVTLCMDTIKINGLYFLTTISKNLHYRTAQWVKDQTIKTYLETIEKVIQLYKSADFKVIQIRCDNEFKPLKETLKEKYGIEVNLANPNEHVPEAERNNRVIKERVRATYHRLPYNNLPKILVKNSTSTQLNKLIGF